MFASWGRRLAAGLVGGLLAFTLGTASLEAQGPVRLTGGFGGAVEKQAETPQLTVHVTPEVTGPLARTWTKLQKPVTIAFPNETPLEEFIKYIKQATEDKGDRGIPIYVDPQGLQEAEKSMTSPIGNLTLEGIPLATSLRLALAQLGLTYYVQGDGLLVVVSETNDRPVDPEPRIVEDLWSLRNELLSLRNAMAPRPKRKTGPPAQSPTTSGTHVTETALRRVAQAGGDVPEKPDGSDEAAPLMPFKTVRLAAPLSAAAAETWMRLSRPVPIAFENETPLEIVIVYLKKATHQEGARALQVYIDPVGLQEAEKTMTSPIKLNIDGIPLATSLTLMLKQLGLRYYVQHDGIIMISSELGKLGDDAAGTWNRPAKILDQISLLRMEVATMRTLQAAAETASREK